MGLNAAASSLEWAHFYLEHRAQPIPVPFKSKAPTVKEWPDLRVTHDTVPEYFNGARLNVGILLGDASGGLMDVDLDCREAVILASRFLPATPCCFGRESTGAAHWLYRVDPVMPTTKFEDVQKGAAGERSMLVELRGDGAQTIVPPSVHPSGERIMFVGGPVEHFAPAEVGVGDLLRHVRLLALACLLARHWPDEGARHDAALGAAGLLLGSDLPVDDVVRAVTAAAQVSGDRDATTRGADVYSTAEKIAAGERVLGGPALAKVLTGDGEAVVKRIKQWLGIQRAADPRWYPPTDRPEIDTGNLGLAEMAREAWDAIERANDPPVVYRFGSPLAWLVQDPAGRLQVEVMEPEHVRHHLADVATFVRWNGRAEPPTGQETGVPSRRARRRSHSCSAAGAARAVASGPRPGLYRRWAIACPTGLRRRERLVLSAAARSDDPRRRGLAHR